MEKLVNFRDIGGYKTSKGTVVKGKFFRSGEPVDLPEQDKKDLVETYHIQHLFDFRKEDEVVERPDDTIPGISYHHINIMKDVSKDSSFTSMVEVTGSPEKAMMLIYKNIITDPGSQRRYKRFLEAIYDYDQEAILFHCFAGKDRTGVAAAFILKMLGVSDEDIYEDYLKTNVMRKAANDATLKELADQGVSQDILEKTEVMLSVQKEYLDYAFEIIEKEYGGFDNYVKNQLKLDDHFIEKMQARFIK